MLPPFLPFALVIARSFPSSAGLSRASNRGTRETGARRIIDDYREDVSDREFAFFAPRERGEERDREALCGASCDLIEGE